MGKNLGTFCGPIRKVTATDFVARQTTEHGKDLSIGCWKSLLVKVSSA